MSNFRKRLDTVDGESVTKTEGYLSSLNDLRKSTILKYFFEGKDAAGSVVIRPSGTEPKLKAYISVTAENREATEVIEQRITVDLERRL